jgi:hypothetical protein
MRKKELRFPGSSIGYAYQTEWKMNIQSHQGQKGTKNSALKDVMRVEWVNVFINWIKQAIREKIMSRLR